MTRSHWPEAHCCNVDVAEAASHSMGERAQQRSYVRTVRIAPTRAPGSTGTATREERQEHVPSTHRRLPALGSFRTYVGLLRYNFGAKRPNYLPTQLPSAASGRKTYLPTYLPIPGGRRENTSLPTYLPEVAKSQKKTDETRPWQRRPHGRRPEAAREPFAWVWTGLARAARTRRARTERGGAARRPACEKTSPRGFIGS